MTPQRIAFQQAADVLEAFIREPLGNRKLNESIESNIGISSAFAVLLLLHDKDPKDVLPLSLVMLAIGIISKAINSTAILSLEHWEKNRTLPPQSDLS